MEIRGIRQLLIYCLFPVLLFVLFSCKSENKSREDKPETTINVQNHEPNYQAIWEKALAERNFSLIDSLIADNRKFKLSSKSMSSAGIDVYLDTLSDPLECVFYWSLIQNSNLGGASAGQQFSLKDIEANINFLNGIKDYTYSYQGLWLADDMVGYRKNKEKKDSVLKELKIERDRLQNQIKDWREEGKSNLPLIKYCLDKGMKLDYNSARCLTSGSDRDWPVNEISVLYYFDSIATHKNYFQENDEYLSEITLTSEFISYVMCPYLNLSLLKEMYRKGINKKLFLESVYSRSDEEFIPETYIVAYRAEKLLFELMPEEMVQYSGHTLLHAAINNFDVPAIKEIITFLQKE